MKSYLKRQARFFGAIMVAVFLVGLVGAFSVGLGFVLFILGGPALLAVLLVGSAVLFGAGFRQARQSNDWATRSIAALSTPFLLTVTILASWGLYRAGYLFGELTRLSVNHSHYEAIIAKAQASKEAKWLGEDRGVKYSVDRGPPVRVAFDGEGFLDNWSGIVFDPTGEVMKAHGFDARGKFFAPDRITKLFGGDMVSCRHLWGNYYDCSFT